MAREMDKVRLLVTMEENRGLQVGEVQDVTLLEDCIADGWVVASGEWGWVLSGPGMQHLTNFRALFDLDRYGRPISE